MKQHLAVFLVLLAVSGCSILETGSERDFTYRAFDSAGNVVAEGTLSIDFVPTDEDGERLIRGERQISLVVDSAVVGPQIGVSSIKGEEDDGFVEINLTPDGRKNLQLGEEVVLSGQLSADEDEIQGVWRYYKTEGATRQLASGTFEAKRP